MGLASDFPYISTLFDTFILKRNKRTPYVY
jgi:hypothetical protein